MRANYRVHLFKERCNLSRPETAAWPALVVGVSLTLRGKILFTMNFRGGRGTDAVRWRLGTSGTPPAATGRVGRAENRERVCYNFTGRTGAAYRPDPPDGGESPGPLAAGGLAHYRPGSHHASQPGGIGKTGTGMDNLSLLCRRDDRQASMEMIYYGHNKQEHYPFK